MGPPAQQATVGETEVWSYPSGGDTRTFGSAIASTNSSEHTNVFGSPTNAFGSTTASTSANVFGSSYSVHRYCVVNIVMTGGRVTAVNYTGRTGGWGSQGEQCAFAVQNCFQ